MNPLTRSILLAIPFSAVVTGLFNLGELLPWPLAVLAGVGWGALMGLLGFWLSRRWPTPAENVLVAAGVTGFAFAGCGGLMGILLLKGALNSSSLTGESLEQMFLPSIPYYIAVNSVLEVLVVPLLLVVGRRPGRRRPLIVAAVLLYFAMRIWTYLTFVPSRLGWAESDHASRPLTPAELDQAARDLMLDDPRWAMVLAMFVLLLSAALLRPTRGDVHQRHPERRDDRPGNGPEAATGHRAAL